MVYRPNLDDRSCFVMLPLRAPFLGYFDQIIRPAVAELGLVAEKADDVYGTRPVIRDIWEQIWRAHIAIAIVTGKNPNVNYELGICHTLGIPTILLTEKEQDVPFDYRHRRYIHYKVKNAGWEQRLRDDIRNTVQALLSTKEEEIDLPWPYDTTKLMRTSLIETPVDDDFARQMVMRGIDVSLSVIQAAFGPDGRGVTQQTKLGPQLLVKSGIRVLQAISSGNQLQMQGIEAVRQLANDMHLREGDLSKTAVLLGVVMIKSGEASIRSGVPVRQFLIGMEQALDAAASSVLALARPMQKSDFYSIAYTASRDSYISSLISEAFAKAGEDGLVYVEEWDGDTSVLDFYEGLQLDRGYITPEFVADHGAVNVF